MHPVMEPYCTCHHNRLVGILTSVCLLYNSISQHYLTFVQISKCFSHNYHYYLLLLLVAILSVAVGSSRERQVESKTAQGKEEQTKESAWCQKIQGGSGQEMRL